MRFLTITSILLVLTGHTFAADAVDLKRFVTGAGGSGVGSAHALRVTVGESGVGFGVGSSFAVRTGFWAMGSGLLPGCCVGMVGDANGIGGDEPTIGDISVMIDAKFISGTCEGTIACLDEADVNQSAESETSCNDITIGDISILIDYLYITGPPSFGPLLPCP